MTPAMSSQTFDKLNDKLKRAYHAVLLQIVHDLEKDQQDELRFYYTELIPKGNTGTLHILRSLENAGKISWEDVCFLKEGLREVRRWDLEKTLTAFEIKRDLSVLLDFYARKIQDPESGCRPAPESVEKVAGYLVKLITEIVRDGFDVSNAVRSLMEPKKGIKKVLEEFEEEIERELSNSCSKLAVLVVIAGEIVAAALAKEEQHQKDEQHQRPEALKLCSTAADEICSRMMKLELSWVS